MKVPMICLYALLDTKTACIFTKTQLASGVLEKIHTALVSRRAYKQIIGAFIYVEKIYKHTST